MMGEIKKALEGVTPGPWFEGDKWVFVSPRSGLMNEALENVLRNDEAQANARYIAAVNPAAIAELISTLESLQRENEALRANVTRTRKFSLDMGRACDLAEIDADHLLSRAEAAEAEVKQMRDRYECWMPVTVAPPAGTHPDALLEFYCISDEVDGDESPEYWKTDTWQDKPADAVYWCAIVSPLGPHARTFIARTALASTGGQS